MIKVPIKSNVRILKSSYYILIPKDIVKSFDLQKVNSVNYELIIEKEVSL
jgi:hypothetical protein